MNIETEKLIRVKAGEDSTRIAISQPIYKEDYGLYLFIEGLELPAVYTVDFSNSETVGTAVSMLGNADGVLIPQQFIKSGKTIYAFLYLVGTEVGKTVYKFKIPNRIRPDRTNEQPTPEEQSIIDQAIAALNDAVEQTAQDVIDADASAQSASDSADRAEIAEQDAENAADVAHEYADSASASANSANQSATASAQSASASAQSASDAEQTKQEVEGLVSDAQDSANEAKSYATQASNSADDAQGHANTAHGYATDASNSADTATTKANEASGYAQTASQKATEASGYADTSSQKASESAQSASSALGYKNDAEQAKTDAQTAQGLAEQAKADAITAKNDAESARDEAQSIVDGISGKVEQIDQNTADIASLEDDRYKPYAVDSASGAIASFVDGADDIPLKSLVVDINPVQDLHGYDSPWVGGGGKNLFNIRSAQPFNNNVTLTFGADDSLTCKNENGYSVNALASIVLQLSADTYTISAISFPSKNIPIYASEDGVTWAWYANALSTSVKSKTVTIDKPYIRLHWSVDANETATCPPIQIEKGSTATDWTPYENICPISGWTGMQLNVNGTVIPISWQTEAGTVYGGRLDVLNGELVVDRALLTLNTADMNNANLYPGWKNIGIRDIIGSGINSVVAGILNVGKYCAVNTIGANDIIYLPLVRYNNKTEDEWKALAIDIQILANYATPITIQLTPHQVNSLLGANNIWADTGDTTLEYRADPEMYIERQMPEVSVDDVQINGSSIVVDGVANVPIGTTSKEGVFKVALDANIKAGSGSAVVVPTGIQHKSVFYGLAKAASDTTQSQSSNAVGVYTDEAKIAIQKMLGIYEAPWELIREDTFTYEEATAHVINTDANGEAFELTEVVFLFETPVQETDSALGSYGSIYAHFNVGFAKKVECIAWTQAANSSAHGCGMVIKRDGNLVEMSRISSITNGNTGVFGARYGVGFLGIQNDADRMICDIDSTSYVTKIRIASVLGTGHYKLYGRRKWQ